MISAEEFSDERGLGGQRKRIPHGNMRAKLLNYIGQVFECKADIPHSSRRVLANWWGERVRRDTEFEVLDSKFQKP